MGSKLVVKEINANYDDDRELFEKVLKVVNIDFDKQSQTISLSLDVGEDDHYVNVVFDLDDFEHAIAKAKANPIEE